MPGSFENAAIFRLPLPCKLMTSPEIAPCTRMKYCTAWFDQTLTLSMTRLSDCGQVLRTYLSSPVGAWIRISLSRIETLAFPKRLQKNLGVVLFKVTIDGVNGGAVELNGGVVVIETRALNHPFEIGVIFNAVRAVVEDVGIGDGDGFARIHDALGGIQADIVSQNQSAHDLVDKGVVAPLKTAVEAGHPHVD